MNGEEEVRASSTAANLFAALAAEALEDETDFEVPSDPQPQAVVVPQGQVIFFFILFSKLIIFLFKCNCYTLIILDSTIIPGRFFSAYCNRIWYSANYHDSQSVISAGAGFNFCRRTIVACYCTESKDSSRWLRSDVGCITAPAIYNVG